MHEFLEDTDVHGLRFVSRSHSSTARRLTWFVFLVTCCGGFVALSALRVRYYLTYPFTERQYFLKDKIRLPGIALCRSNIDTGFLETVDINKLKPKVLFYYFAHIDYPRKGARKGLFHWKNVSSVNSASNSDIVIASVESRTRSFIQRLNTSDVQVLRNQLLYKVNEVWVKELRDIVNNDTLVRIVELLKSGVRDNIEFSRGDIEAERMRQYLTEAINQYVHVEGYYLRKDRKRYRHHSLLSGRRMVNCAIFRNQHCHMFDQRFKEGNSTDIIDYFSSNFVTLYDLDMVVLKFAYSPPNLSPYSLFILDPHELPYSSFTGSPPIHLPLENTKLRVMVTKSYEITHLSTPYADTECEYRYEERQTCIQKCYMKQNACTLPGFSYHRAANQSMGVCHALTQYKLDASCGKRCQNLCKEVGISKIITKDKLTAVYGRRKQMIMYELYIFPLKTAYHIISNETPLYPADALLAELGGALGLFVGASILTMLHIAEGLFMCLKRLIIRPTTTMLYKSNRLRGWAK